MTFAKTAIAAIVLSSSFAATSAIATEWQPGFNPNPGVEAPNGGGIEKPVMPGTGTLPGFGQDAGFTPETDVEGPNGSIERPDVDVVVPTKPNRPVVDEDFTHPGSDNVDPDFTMPPSVDEGFDSVSIDKVQDHLIGENTAGIQQNSNAIAGLNNRVDGLDRRMDDMAKDIDTLNDGVAGAMAMSALPQAFMPETTVVGFGAATFNGSTAIAVGASHKFNENWTGNLKASFGGETGLALGVGYQW